MQRSSLSRDPRNTRRRQLHRHKQLTSYESEFWQEQHIVAGLDEAGMGPLAGPVTAACVVLSPQCAKKLVGVDDSKILSEKKRQELSIKIQHHASAWSVAYASVKEIEDINIREAGLLAMSRALHAVLVQIPDVAHILIDARTLPRIPIEQTSLIKGDSRSISIAAASILAKVARDRHMQAMGKLFPDYGFERNKGYGTQAHLKALQNKGVTPVHRKTFEPIRTMMTQLSLFK